MGRLSLNYTMPPTECNRAGRHTKKPFLPFLHLSPIIMWKKRQGGVAVVSDMELRLEPKQVLQVSPQMLLATRMLLMPAQELSDYLARAAEENPLLERLEPCGFSSAAKGRMPSSLRIRRRSDGGTLP